MSWANGHDRCTSCGTDEHNHKTRGLCGYCYDTAAEKRHKSHVTRRTGSQLPIPITKEDLEQKYKSGLSHSDIARGRRNGHEGLTLLELVLQLEGDIRRRLDQTRVTPLQAEVLLFLRRHAEAKVTDAAAATPAQKTILSKLSPDQVQAAELAGDKIIATLTIAPGNGASIGGLKVVTEQGWFAARPSGTEDVYKLYAESFRGKDHLNRIQEEAQALIGKALTVSRQE